MHPRSPIFLRRAPTGTNPKVLNKRSSFLEFLEEEFVYISYILMYKISLFGKETQQHKILNEFYLESDRKKVKP